MKLNKSKFIFHFITNLFVMVSVIIFKSISCVSAKEINHSKFADHQQNHSKGVIWTDIKKPPAISLMITQGSENGWIVTTNVKNFLFAPKKAGKKHVSGEGHMHLYINNKKTARLYGFPYYLNNLKIGDHEIKVTLNSNDHRDYKLSGKTIKQSIKIKQLQKSLSKDLKALKTSEEPDFENSPELEIDVKKDPIKGWNLILKNKNFVLSQNDTAIKEDQKLSGFGKLYINDKYKTRIFGSVFHIPNLPSGSNEIRIELCSNSDLSPYIINGKSISDSIFLFNSKIDTSSGSITQKNNTL